MGITLRGSRVVLTASVARMEPSVVPALPPLVPGTLYLVATPIGNLEDITLRALRVLRECDVVAAEDTRHTGQLLKHFGITKPLLSYFKFNEARRSTEFVERLRRGEKIALVTDAGSPGISDPGGRVVAAAVAAGCRVEPVPGACALIAGLTASGLPTDEFHFVGFLPHKSGQRANRLASLVAVPGTLVFYESPQRLAESLADLAAVLGDRPAAVCRELTKLHEEVRRGGLADLAATYGAADTPKGEVVVVVGGAPADQAEVDDDAIDAALKDAMATMSVRDAAAAVATALGQPRRVVYAKALALAKK